MDAPNIIWLDELNSERNYAKLVLEKARSENALSFLFFPHEKSRLEAIVSHCQSYCNKEAVVIHARNCEVRQIDKNLMMDFCDLYHIQGSNRLSVYQCGLFYKNELVGVMSLGKHHRINEDKANIVLDRFCFKNNIRVNGGASRLFCKCKHWALENEYANIWTYSDNRYTNGKVYEVLGFTKSEILPQDYFYVCKTNYHEYHSKQSQKKDLVGCPEHITEKIWAEEKNNLMQVYDCGKVKWNYILRKEYRKLQSFASRRCGYYPSIKGITDNLYFQSSYELRAYILLDQNPEVEKYITQVRFFSKGGQERFADILVYMKDGTKKIQEVKPKSRIEQCILQIEDLREYANINKYGFEIISEEELGFTSEHYLLKWADQYLSKLKMIDFVEKRRLDGATKAKKHYHKHNKFINVFCDSCKDIHNIREKQYESNVRKNGFYKCGKKNGSLVGKLPKDHLRVNNPYAAEGKKECRKCKEIKIIDGNFTWKSKPSDKNPTGTRSPDCNECRKSIEQHRYHDRKNKKNSS